MTMSRDTRLLIQFQLQIVTIIGDKGCGKKPHLFQDSSDEEAAMREGLDPLPYPVSGPQMLLLPTHLEVYAFKPSHPQQASE